MNGNEREWMEPQPNSIPPSPRPAQLGTHVSYEIAGSKVLGGGNPHFNDDDDDNILNLMTSIRMHMIMDKGYPKSESSNVRRMAGSYPVKSRSRCRSLKPHETPPFLKLDSGQELHKASTDPPSISLVTSKDVTPWCQEESSGHPQPYGSRPISAQTSQQSAWESPRRPNVHVQAPFKHSVHKPAMSTDRYPPPCQELQHRTLIAQQQMSRLLSSPRRSPPRKKYGRLLKAKLKPLYPVDVTGPSIHQCRGILAEKRSYSANGNKTLTRRRQLMAHWNGGELEELLRQPVKSPLGQCWDMPSSLADVQHFNQHYLDSYLDQVGIERGDEGEADSDDSNNHEVDLPPSPIPSPIVPEGMEQEEGSGLGSATSSTIAMRKSSPRPCSGDLSKDSYPDFNSLCGSRKGSAAASVVNGRGGSGKGSARGKKSRQAQLGSGGSSAVSTANSRARKKGGSAGPPSANSNNNAAQDGGRLDSEPRIKLNMSLPTETDEGTTEMHAGKSSNGPLEDSAVPEAPVKETGDAGPPEAKSEQPPDDSAEVTPSAKDTLLDEPAGESASLCPPLSKSPDESAEIATPDKNETVKKAVADTEDAHSPKTKAESRPESPEKVSPADKDEADNKSRKPEVGKSRDNSDSEAKETDFGVGDPSGDENNPPLGDGKRNSSTDSAAKPEKSMPNRKGRSFSQGDISLHAPDGNTNNNGLFGDLSSSRAIINKPILVNRSDNTATQATGQILPNGEAVAYPTSGSSAHVPLSRPQTAGEMLKDRQPSRGKSVRFADTVVQTPRRGQSAGALSSLGQARKAVRSGRATCKPYVFSVSSQEPDDEDRDRKNFGVENLRINSMPLSAPGEKTSSGPAGGSKQAPRGQTRSDGGTAPRDEGGAVLVPKGSNSNDDKMKRPRTKPHSGKQGGQAEGMRLPETASNQKLLIIINSEDQEQMTDISADSPYSDIQDRPRWQNQNEDLAINEETVDPEAMVPTLKNHIRVNLDHFQQDSYNGTSDFSEDSDENRERIIWIDDIEPQDPPYTSKRTSSGLHQDEESTASATVEAADSEAPLQKKTRKRGSANTQKKLSHRKYLSQHPHKAATQRHRSGGDVKVPQPAMASADGDSMGPESEGEQIQALFKKDRSGRVKGLVLQGTAPQPQEAEFPMSLSVRKFHPKSAPLKPQPGSSIEPSRKEVTKVSLDQQVQGILAATERGQVCGGKEQNAYLGLPLPMDQREFLRKSLFFISASSASNVSSRAPGDLQQGEVISPTRKDSTCKITLPELFVFLQDPRCQELIDLKPEWPRSNRPYSSQASLSPLWKMHHTPSDLAASDSRSLGRPQCKQEGFDHSGRVILPEHLASLSAEERERAILEYIQRDCSLAVDENTESKFARMQSSSIGAGLEEADIAGLQTASEEDFNKIAATHLDCWRSTSDCRRPVERAGGIQPQHPESLSNSTTDDESSNLWGSCPEGLSLVDPEESDSFSCLPRPGTKVLHSSASSNCVSSDLLGESDLYPSSTEGPSSYIVSSATNTGSSTGPKSELADGVEDHPENKQGELEESQREPVLERMAALLEHLKKPLHQAEVENRSSDPGSAMNSEVVTPTPVVTNSSSAESRKAEVSQYQGHRVFGQALESSDTQKQKDAPHSPSPSRVGSRLRASSMTKEQSPTSPGAQCEDSILEDALKITRGSGTAGAGGNDRGSSTMSQRRRLSCPNSVHRQLGQPGGTRSQSQPKSSSDKQLIPRPPGYRTTAPIAAFNAPQSRVSVMQLFAGSEIPDPEVPPASTHSVDAMRVIGKPPLRKPRPGVPHSPVSASTKKRNSPKPRPEKEVSDSVENEEGRVAHPLNEHHENLRSFQELEEELLRVKEELRQEMVHRAHRSAASDSGKEDQGSTEQVERRVTFFGEEECMGGFESPTPLSSSGYQDSPPSEDPSSRLIDLSTPDPFARLREFRRQCRSLGPGCLQIPEQLVSCGGLGRLTPADTVTGPLERHSSMEEAASHMVEEAPAAPTPASTAPGPEASAPAVPKSASAAPWPVFDDAQSPEEEKETLKAEPSLLEVIADSLPEPQKVPKQQQKSAFSGESKHPLEVVANPVTLMKPKTNQKKKTKEMVARFPPLCFQINARPPQGHFFYFAYGLDMDKDRLSFYLKHQVQRRYWGVLYGFSLTFNKQGLDSSAGGFPTLEYDPYNSVEGCIYVLRVEYLAWLDKCVGAPVHYARLVLPVWMSNSNDPNIGVAQHCVACMMYIAQDDWICKGEKLCCTTALNQCMSNTDILSPDYIAHQHSKHQASGPDSAAQPSPLCVSA